MVSVDPLIWADGAATPSAGSTWGPLIASQARPIERLTLPGGLRLPLAINAHTGGLSDWPARLVYGLTGSAGAVRALNIALGALLIVLVHRFLARSASAVAAGVAAVFLATDWAFLFYKQVLGGTELTLQLAGLLCLLGLWRRRWAGGRHGLLLLGFGLGLGVQAKLTFVLSFAALALAALALRRDRPSTQPPLPSPKAAPLLALLFWTAPLWLTWIHHRLGVPASPHVNSHDFAGMQVGRVTAALTGAATPTREGLENLFAWAISPLPFFARAYGATGAPAVSIGRIIGWGLLFAGVGFAWVDRHPTPRQALLRLTSLTLLLQVGLLWLVARDLHHLAMAEPTLALVVGLSTAELAARFGPQRSFVVTAVAALLCAPWAISGIDTLRRTDPVLSTISVPTFTAAGQAALVEMVRGAGVERLTLCNYEAMGVFELMIPEIAVQNAWGAASRAEADLLPHLLRVAVGGHLLIVRSSAPMIYDRHPRAADLRRAAESEGLTVEPVAALPDGAAELYAIR